MGTDDTAKIDGRRARGVRTRLQVLEAFLVLVEEGNLRPTAFAVAERAGVALRTVYHHFEDVEELRRQALELQLERQSHALQPIDAASDLDTRIRALARQLRKVLDGVTPIRRATILDEHISPATESGLRAFRLLRREHIARSFKPEISQHAAAGRVLLDALDTATTWESWDYLRTDLGRSAVAAEKSFVLVLHDLLARRPAPAGRQRPGS
ncbi:MAG: TetR family transcriptional regulator [Acidimicrobiaceae bacterium]|jgi:TetR/AcrR family transcriptional regulator of autoinduction and epiphytic fitness|nr:TetR family transcriptional regulator [Acidimicrobiaceae bacterium]